MSVYRRISLVMGLVVIGVGVVLMGGAAKSAAQDTESACSTGKPICASITADHEPASWSPAGADHYVSYDLEISYDTDSGSTSNLVNIEVTVTWADVGVTTTSTYVVGSQPACTLTAPRTLTCSPTPKSLGSGESFGYDGLIFRTSSATANPLASGTDVSVTASAKETPKPPKGGSNVAFVKTTFPTTYEEIGDEDTSTAGQGLTTTLVTSNAGAVNQLSRLPVPASAPRGVFQLKEADYNGAASCPAEIVDADLACFGQHVTTTTVTGTSPVNLQIVYEGDRPGNEGDIGVFHERNNGEVVQITATCPSATPTLDQISDLNGCLLINSFFTIPGSSGDVHIEISAWDVDNGGWGGIS